VPGPSTRPPVLNLGELILVSKPTWQHLYGPVPSRRLGRSLGVDLVPYKVCNFDCIYCQLGRTTHKTCERKQYEDPAEVIDELARWLKEDGQADYITFSGLGEPTLNSGLREMVVAANKMTDIPVAILTNGSLLWDPEVRAAGCAADLIMPSLDAATPRAFARVNRPDRSLDIEQIIEGLRATQQECPGKMWLEVMLVEDCNDSREDLAALRAAIDSIDPDEVQINTVVRPPVEHDAKPLSASALQQAEQLLGPKARLIAPLDAQKIMVEERERSEDEVIELLRRRPCTLEDIGVGLGMHPNEAIKYVQDLRARHEIKAIERDGKDFYMMLSD